MQGYYCRTVYINLLFERNRSFHKCHTIVSISSDEKLQKAYTYIARSLTVQNYHLSADCAKLLICRSWYQASNYCNNLNSHLLAFSNLNKFLFFTIGWLLKLRLFFFLELFNTSLVYIGLSKKQVSDQRSNLIFIIDVQERNPVIQPFLVIQPK